MIEYLVQRNPKAWRNASVGVCIVIPILYGLYHLGFYLADLLNLQLIPHLIAELVAWVFSFFGYANPDFIADWYMDVFSKWWLYACISFFLVDFFIRSKS